MQAIRALARCIRIAIAVYLALAIVAAALAIDRLAVSTELPGLAAWELLVLALPWTLVLETPWGRQAGGTLLVAIVLGGVIVNAGLLYACARTLERSRAKRN